MGGKLCVEWHEVLSVNTLRGAYLIRKSDGAMPIPFRCMSNQDRTEFERFAKEKLVCESIDGRSIIKSPCKLGAKP
jgi:hypothetical protein